MFGMRIGLASTLLVRVREKDCRAFSKLSPFHFPKQHFHIIPSTRTRIASAKLVSKSYEEMGRRTYKNVPVNYAIRFSSPMIALTAPSSCLRLCEIRPGMGQGSRRLKQPLVALTQLVRWRDPGGGVANQSMNSGGREGGTEVDFRANARVGGDDQTCHRRHREVQAVDEEGLIEG